MNAEKSTGKIKDDRTKNWNFIVYPESAPENWRDIIDEIHVEWVESPIHDRDVNSDGTAKKEHWHVTVLFPGNKSFEQVEELTKKLNAPIPVKCQSVKGSIRYMAHMDNPEKFQYNRGDIRCHGGASLTDLCAPTATERLQIQKNIFDYIRSNGIIEFVDIVNYAMDEKNDDWLNILANYSTISINAFIRSQRHKFENIERSGNVNHVKGEEGGDS